MRSLACFLTLGTECDIISQKMPIRLILQNSLSNNREKLQALSLAKECYSMKMDLLTNATVVDDAIRFVSQKSKDKEKMESSESNDKEESNEPDYDEDKGQLEEK